VPGPPRGRRRQAVGETWQRIQSMRDAEAAKGGTRSPLLRFARDVILLVKDLVKDPRVPRRRKVAAAIALAYVLSPVDLVPDKIPTFGLVDDLGVATVALRRLLAAAGYDVIYELWRGSDEGLALVLTLGGVQE
jgi:uncharacterized membrane protein YkvA (DUF1232 family)